MKNLHGVEIQPVAERLMELDGKIAEISAEAQALIAGGASLGAVEAEIGFLRTLWYRRETLLNEYRKAGGTVREVHTFAARAADSEEST